MGPVQVRAFATLVLLALTLLSIGKARAAGIILPAGSGFEHVAGGVKIVDGPGAGTFMGRTFANPANGAMGVTETYGLRLGGSNITVNAARAVTLGELGIAVAALGGAAWAGFQIGSPIAKALGHDQFTIGPYRCTATYQGWKCDEGQDSIPGQGTVPGRVYGASAGHTCNSANAGDAAKCFISLPGAPLAPPSVVLECHTNGAAGQTSQPMTCTYTNPSTGSTVNSYSFSQGFFTGQVQAPPTCPPFIDGLNPDWSKPNGGHSPGWDGKCPTGRYGGASPGDVLPGLNGQGGAGPGIPGLGNGPSGAPGLAEDLLEKGGNLPHSGPTNLSGPGTSQGTPQTTTTTSSGGQTTTVTKTPSNTYTYNGDTITYNTTTVTVTNINGTETTTTETTTPEEQSSLCKDSPNVSACRELGQPPNEAPEWQDKNITWEAEALGIGGSCPGDRTWNLPANGITMSWSYGPACANAPAVAAVLAAIVALGCALFIMQAVRS